MTSVAATKWLTPEQAAELLPVGNADWVRQQLRAGKLRGSKIGGRWATTQEALDALVEAGTNDTAHASSGSPPGRRRRRRST